jgi:trans-aconitate methyltransferase
VPEFSSFDQRGYRTVDARSGYGEWAATYEDTVKDPMDLDLLDVIDVEWGGEVVDLGCGTGRTGEWLRGRVDAIDGVDLTPEMLERAAARGVYRTLREGEVSATGLNGSYDIAVCCLVDEHLPTLEPLYAEAARLAPRLVIVGFHPHFIMAVGMPTHFDGADGEPVAIETHVHLMSEHVAAARATGWTLRDMRERVIDDTWIALKPKWERLRDHPVAFAFSWQRA